MMDLESIKERAMLVGASKALTVDGKEPLVQEFLYPALQAGAIYEEQYPLATALGRPLIARYMVEAARAEGAFAVAHGCTGKGNDQVRMELGVAALAPNLKVIGPIRDWGMSRQEEIEYAEARDIPVNARASRFSVDENIWGRVQGHGGRGLVDLPGLDAHQAVLHVVKPPDSVLAQDRVEVGYQVHPGHVFAIDGGGYTLLEMNFQKGRLIRRFRQRFGPRVGVLRRL